MQGGFGGVFSLRRVHAPLNTWRDLLRVRVRVEGDL